MNRQLSQSCIESRLDELFYPIWVQSCKIGLMSKDYREISSDDERAWELTKSWEWKNTFLVCTFTVGLLVGLILLLHP